MKHIIEKWDEGVYESGFWKFYFGDMKVGVLDIETTGLYPARNKFVLGCLYDVTKGELHQVLAQSRAEEPEALSEYLKLIANVDLVVTYNGRHFDMPFIEQRRRITGIAEGPAKVYDLDLYPVLRHHSPIRSLVPNMKQKTIETYMGFWDTRADEISGAESVDLYNEYEATGNPEAEKKILLHNNDDVRQLTKITKAIMKSDFHKAMYTIGFPIKAEGKLVLVESIELKRDLMKVKGSFTAEATDYMGFEYNGWPVQTEIREGKFRFEIPVIRRDGYAVIDIQSSGIKTDEFSEYPGYGNGFIIIADSTEIKYRQTNHFLREFVRTFIREQDLFV